MNLTQNQKKFLKAEAHHLKPVIIIGGQGVTDNLLAELDKTLAHHELIKIKINQDSREDRKAIVEHLVKTTKSLLIQTIGKTLVLFRPKPKNSNIELPRN